MNWIKEIKWAYQRVVRGYDDRLAWDFSDYMLDIVAKPLKSFCLDYLNDQHRSSLNPERSEIFIKTIELIETLEENYYVDSAEINEFWEYFAKHNQWYWD